MLHVNIEATYHAHTPIRLHARIHHCPVVLRLLLQRSRVPRPIQVNIQLGDGHVQSEICEALQVLLERIRNLVECEVTLESNGIDGHAVCDERLHDAVERVGLGVDSFDAVVIYAIIKTVRFVCWIKEQR